MPGENEFDVGSAVAEISDGLGLGDSSDNAGGESNADINLDTGGDSAVNTATDTSGADDSNGDGQSANGEPSPFTPPDTHKHLFNEQGMLRTWRGEAASEFAKLPPVVQQEILKREEDIFKGIEGYKEAAAFGNSLKQVLDPYLPTLQQYGIQPAAQVADMMQAHYTLAFGSPEQKVALIQQVAKDYGVDLRGLSLPLDGAYVDPQVQDLQNQLKQLQSQMSQSQRAQTEAKRAEIERNVSAFASDPKNVYFEELANDIAHLLRTGAEKTVEAAYEKAMWMNPAVRAKELTRQQADKAEAERKAAAEKAEAARKATAANVRTKAKSGSAATPLGSMDDTLTETLAGIRGRG